MKKKFLDLLNQPITNSYLSSINKKNIRQEYFYNLSVMFNTENYLVSLSEPVDPKKQYTDKYAHRASQSITMNKSFKSVANKLKSRFKPNLSMEIGSNDGVFLKNFKKNKIIAVEPCLNLAKITKKMGYLTYPKFWNKNLANKILKKKSKFDLIYSANTISHIPDLKETFDAVYKSLSNDGVFVFEDPYLGSVIQMNSYDQFYDEHVHVFSLIAISNLLKKSKLKVFDVELLNTHGGSIRVYVSNNQNIKETLEVKKILKKEKKLFSTSSLESFKKNVFKSKLDLISKINHIKKQGYKIYGIGAPSRAATLICYTGLDENMVSAILEVKGSSKIGKYMPGTKIPVINENEIKYKNLKYLILFSWHIKRDLKKIFRKKGFKGKFIALFQIAK